MPNIQSARKRLKQSLIRKERNRSAKKAIHTQYKKVVEVVKSGDIERAETEFRAAAKRVDQAAAKKIIHVNAAARVKSRLSAKVKKLKGK
ncbi:MAG: 30S ribosomal protein S20 [Thermoguttaceae bacterium]|jgi:small subunit ribosomal protein S20